MANHPKSEGVLFPNNQKTLDKHPDWRGKLAITREQVEKVVEMAKKGLVPELQIAAWDRKSKQGGNPYKYVEAEAYMKEDTAPPSDSWESAKVPF